MSSPLAIAAVTAVLKDLLNNGVIDHDLTSAVGGNVNVTALPPDRIDTAGQEKNQLNLFLYQVSANLGWRNVGLPSRAQNGELTGNPPLALDLHYLLNAYGEKEFHAEILLGYAMHLLHEHPVLTRQEIRDALATPSPVSESLLPPAFANASAQDLADQIEQIKISPHYLSTEDLSKLWTAFQGHYRMTMAYQVSVVLIEGKHPARTPLPVLTRGKPDLATGRDEGIRVQADLLPAFPALQAVIPPNRQPAVRMGELLTCSGHHLDGDQVRVLFRHAPTARTLELPASGGATAAGFQVQIPPDPPAAPVAADSPLHPDNWQAGVYGVSAVVQRVGQPDRTTNELPVMLAPSVSVTMNVAGDDVTFTATVSPKVWKHQQAVLVIADRELSSEPIAADKTATLTFKTKTKDVPSGEQWVRLRVDGTESILVDRSGALPRFDNTQKVTI